MSRETRLETVTQAIRDLAGPPGRAPTFDEVVGTGVTRRAVMRHFGTYNRAVEAAGLVPNRALRPYRRWNREKMVAAVRELRDMLGRTPTTGDLRAHPELCPSPALVLRRFGSMTNLLREAGLGTDGHASARAHSCGGKRG